MTMYWNVIHRDFFAQPRLWYDQILNGTSLLANPLYGLFYLPNACYLLLSSDVALRCYLALHYALIGGGASVWASLHGVRPRVAILAALMLVGSGVIFSMPMRGIPYFAAVCWLPWIAAVAMISGRGRRWSQILTPMIAAGALTGLGLCAGDVQMLAYGPVFAITAYGSGVYYRRRAHKETAPTRSPMAWLAVAGHRLMKGVVLATGYLMGCVATSAVVLFHGWQAWRLSPRSAGLGMEEVIAFSFHPYRLLEFFWPIFGRPGTPSFNGQDYTSSFSWHTWWYPHVDFGPLALVILMAGLWKLRRRRQFWGYAMAAGAMLLWSFGRWNSVVTLLLEHVPLLRSVRYPAKLVLPACILSLPLIWLGLTATLRRLDQYGGRYAKVAFVALALALLLPLINQSDPFTYFDKGWSIPLPWMKEIGVASSEVSPVRLLIDHLIPTSSLTPQERTLISGSPIAWGLKAQQSVDAAELPLERFYLTRDDFTSAAARENFGFNVLVTSRDLSPALQAACDKGELICKWSGDTGGLSVLKAKELPKRWSLVANWQTGEVKDLLEAHGVAPSMTDGSVFLSMRRYLDHHGLPQLAPPPVDSVMPSTSPKSPCARMNQVQFADDYAKANFDVEVWCPTLLAVNLRFVPGWRVTIDQQPTWIGEINGMMLGILLPLGKHKVDLAFSPVFADVWLQLMIVMQLLTCIYVGVLLFRTSVLTEGQVLIEQETSTSATR
jgi:hypothetical protein